MGRGLVVDWSWERPERTPICILKRVVDGSWIGRESGRGLVVDWSWIGRGLVVRRSSQRVRDAIRDGSVTPFMTHNL